MLHVLDETGVPKTWLAFEKDSTYSELMPAYLSGENAIKTCHIQPWDLQPASIGYPETSSDCDQHCLQPRRGLQEIQQSDLNTMAVRRSMRYRPVQEDGSWSEASVTFVSGLHEPPQSDLETWLIAHPQGQGMPLESVTCSDSTTDYSVPEEEKPGLFDCATSFGSACLSNSTAENDALFPSCQSPSTSPMPRMDADYNLSGPFEPITSHSWPFKATAWGGNTPWPMQQHLKDGEETQGSWFNAPYHTAGLDNHDYPTAGLGLVSAGHDAHGLPVVGPDGQDAKSSFMFDTSTPELSISPAEQCRVNHLYTWLGCRDVQFAHGETCQKCSRSSHAPEAERAFLNSAEERTQPHRNQANMVTLPRHSDGRNAFLIECKRQGMSYKDIKRIGGFREAESTLRGRFRTLTKSKEQRVRKPKWQEKDIQLLCQAVNSCSNLCKRAPGSRHASCVLNEIEEPPKVSWKKVGQYIWTHGGSYHFGNSTCKKKWCEIHGLRI